MIDFREKAVQEPVANKYRLLAITDRAHHEQKERSFSALQRRNKGSDADPGKPGDGAYIEFFEDWKTVENPLPERVFEMQHWTALVLAARPKGDIIYVIGDLDVSEIAP